MSISSGLPFVNLPRPLMPTCHGAVWRAVHKKNQLDTGFVSHFCQLQRQKEPLYLQILCIQSAEQSGQIATVSCSGRINFD